MQHKCSKQRGGCFNSFFSKENFPFGSRGCGQMGSAGQTGILSQVGTPNQGKKVCLYRIQSKLMLLAANKQLTSSWMCSHFHKVVYSYVESTCVFDHALVAWSTLTCPAPLRGRWTPEKDGRLVQDGTRYAPVNGHRHPLILSRERHCKNWYLLYYGRDENQTNTAVQNLGWVHLVSTYEGGHLKRGANH